MLADISSGVLAGEGGSIRPTIATFNYLSPGMVGERVRVCRVNEEGGHGGGDVVNCVVKGKEDRNIVHGCFDRFETFEFVSA